MNTLKTLMLSMVLLCTTTIAAQETESKTINSKFSFDLSYGFGFRLGKLVDNASSAEKSLYDKTKKGGNIYLELSYKINDESSIGLAFNQFSGKGSIKSQNIIIGGNDFGNGSWDNYTRISFLGPKYNYQATTPNGKGELMAGVGLGALMYYADDDINVSNGGSAQTKGSTIGFITTASYHHFIGKGIAIGARIGYIGGALSKAKVTSGGTTTEVKLKDDQKESLSQIYLNAGLRVYF